MHLLTLRRLCRSQPLGAWLQAAQPSGDGSSRCGASANAGGRAQRIHLLSRDALGAYTVELYQPRSGELHVIAFRAMGDHPESERQDSTSAVPLADESVYLTD